MPRFSYIGEAREVGAKIVPVPAARGQSFVLFPAVSNVVSYTLAGKGVW